LRPSSEDTCWRTGYEAVGATGSCSATAPTLPAGGAAKVWKVVGLDPIGLHEAGHTFASLMIAAGVNAKALSTYMGHSSITITLDRYGHLMPGNEEQAAGLLDAYLAAEA
jgi:integrase